MLKLESRIGELRAIEIENDWLRLSILPEVGAKIFDFVWKPTGRNFLWHNPRILPQRYPVDGSFDNYWCGGWDEGFPTCDECDFRGEHYPSLGELRSLHWNLEAAAQEDHEVVICLSAFGPISPVRVRKVVRLAKHVPVARMQYEITNLGPPALDFIWGTHPALQVTPSTVLRIPAKTGIVGLVSDSRLGTPGQSYPWPTLETPSGRMDIGQVQDAQAKTFYGHCATDLEAGWYAVEDAKTGQGFLLTFPQNLCPYLWLWLVYGGWRGYHHVIVEPWTSYPINLAGAFNRNTHRHLEAGEKFSVEVLATAYAHPETWQQALKRLER
jgi:galactose mutarotase-like enzyme